MISAFEFEELLNNINKPKKPSVMTEQHKNKYVSYLTDFPQYKGIGQSEEESLTNLSNLLKEITK